MKSRLEQTFLHYWRALGGPALEREHVFHPERRWRFDFALVDRRVAFEVEGGQWTGGRHTRGLGFAADCEKYNAAAMAGWRVLRFTQSMVARPTLHIEPVVKWVKGDLEESNLCRLPAVTSRSRGNPTRESKMPVNGSHPVKMHPAPVSKKGSTR